MITGTDHSRMTTLVLLSGGLDSAVLAAHEAQASRVLPVYVSVGLAWENAEVAMVKQLLAAPVFAGKVEPLARVSFTMRDVYADTHWAIRGVPPAYDTPDEDVYLTGRNLVLLTKAGVIAAKARAARIALGPLAGNPFPDARPAFFSAMEQALTLGLDHRLEIATPFLTWEKEHVIKRGVELGVPLELTLSCMNPPSLANTLESDGGTSPASVPMHCGLCSKCRERRDAFAAAGVSDPSTYANRSPR
jgi:7-cyano-7-deazaguanine synthase